MMASFYVTVMIRKGLGPEFVTRNLEVGFDDLEEDVSDGQLRQMAIAEVDSMLRKSIDYPHYGKNWRITYIERL